MENDILIELLDEMEQMPEEFAEVVRDNFWQLLDDEQLDRWERSLVEPIGD